MAELKTSGVKSVSGEYDFRNDPSAGAIGNIRMGVYLPGLAIITGFWVTGLSDITSGGAATISFGTIINPSTIVNNNLFAAAVLATFATNGQPVRGVDLDATPLRLVTSAAPFSSTDREIVMAIGVAALTAGRLQFNLTYTENLIPGGIPVIIP